MNMLRGMSTEHEYTTSLAPTTYLEAGFGNDYSAPANPNALRRQAVNFDEALTQPKREARRPPASAFQSAACQECEQNFTLCRCPFWAVSVNS